MTQEDGLKLLQIYIIQRYKITKLLLFLHFRVILLSLLIKVSVKVKNDHRSEFSNLSNWKEEA